MVILKLLLLSKKKKSTFLQLIVQEKFQNFEEMVWLSDKKALFHVF